MVHQRTACDIWDRIQMEGLWCLAMASFIQHNSCVSSVIAPADHISFALSLFRLPLVLLCHNPMSPQGHPSHIKSGNVSASIVIRKPLEAPALDLGWIWASLFSFIYLPHLSEGTEREAELSVMFILNLFGGVFACHLLKNTMVGGGFRIWGNEESSSNTYCMREDICFI